MTDSEAYESLKDLREHIRRERDFNETWIALHLRDGHPAASERRREIVAERDRWLTALDSAIVAAAKSAFARPETGLPAHERKESSNETSI